MFRRKKKEKEFPCIEFLRDVMGIELTQHRYDNLKRLSMCGLDADAMVTALIVLANFKSIQTKPFRGDADYDSGNDTENK